MSENRIIRCAWCAQEMIDGGYVIEGIDLCGVGCMLKWFSSGGLTGKRQQQADPVSHPPHYQSDKGIECIDAIRAALGPEGFQAFCRGSMMKYAWRAGLKGQAATDLAKAEQYAKFAREKA